MSTDQGASHMAGPLVVLDHPRPTTHDGGAATMAEEFAYRNRNDGNHYLFDAPRPDLDALDNFERVDPGTVPQHVHDALARARAERASIEAAAGTRAERVEARGTEETAAAAVLATSIGNETPAMTGAHLAVEPPSGLGGVLSRNRPAAPSREELERQAAADTTALTTQGVLSRNRLETGATGGVPLLDQQDGSTPAAGKPGEAAGSGPDAPASSGDGKPDEPGKNANKPEWITYAKDVEKARGARGDARQHSDDEIDGMTVKQLQDAYATKSDS
ncbi:hypothetical protein JNW90_10600 [Micromonospora sp. STR1s_5]|nr:hypothetical protein [Micromonospora sp. STR1s_5]